MSRRCADAVIASLAIAGVAKELGMLTTTSPFFFVAGISSDITSKEKPRSGGKTQLVETRVLRTEIDVEADVAPGAQRSFSSSTSASSSSWSSVKSQTSVVQQNKSPPARTAERRTATTEQASTKSPGDGSTEALASNSKRSANAAVQQQARAMKLSSSKKLLMSQKKKESSTPSQAYAIKGIPGPGGWAPWQNEGLGCGGLEGTEALVDKRMKLGVLCCGDSPTVIAAGGTILTYFYTYPNGNRLDCKAPPNRDYCGSSYYQGISWDEAAAVCSAYESRRLCTVEEMRLMRPGGKGDILESLCTNCLGLHFSCNGHCVWTADEPVTVSDTAANDTSDAVAEDDEASAVEAGTTSIVLAGTTSMIVLVVVVLALAAVCTAFALGIIGGDAAPGPTDAAPGAAAY